PLTPTLFPYTTLFRSEMPNCCASCVGRIAEGLRSLLSRFHKALYLLCADAASLSRRTIEGAFHDDPADPGVRESDQRNFAGGGKDRKSTRLNSSHVSI